MTDIGDRLIDQGNIELRHFKRLANVSSKYRDRIVDYLDEVGRILNLYGVSQDHVDGLNYLGLLLKNCVDELSETLGDLKESRIELTEILTEYIEELKSEIRGED